MFCFCFLLIGPYSHLRHWLPFFPHQTKELKHSIKQFRLQFRGRSAAVCFGLQVRWTARVKTTAPIIFNVHPHPGSAAPPRYTSRHCPIPQRRRASSAAEKALFSFLFFFFCSGDDDIPVDAPQHAASYGCMFSLAYLEIIIGFSFAPFISTWGATRQGHPDIKLKISDIQQMFTLWMSDVTWWTKDVITGTSPVCLAVSTCPGVYLPRRGSGSSTPL